MLVTSPSYPDGGHIFSMQLPPQSELKKVSAVYLVYLDENGLLNDYDV